MCYTDGDDSPPSHLKVQVRLYYVYMCQGAIWTVN